jgi:hypothetical protein
VSAEGRFIKKLVMTLDYTVRGHVRISMFDYVDDGYLRRRRSPGRRYKAPLDLDEDCVKLQPDKAVAFHNFVTKMLFTTKRARPDKRTSFAFLTTRARRPDKDGRRNLIHLMNYLRRTRKLPLILSADGSGILKWCVDSSFAVHPNIAV